MSTDAQTSAQNAEKVRSIDDGFGNEWDLCAHPKCDLQIVRPGKVQCSNYCWSDFETAFPGEQIDGEATP